MTTTSAPATRLPDATLRSLIEDELAHLVSLRHDLHQTPELCFTEHKTSARVQAELDAIGLDYKAGLAETGVVGFLPATDQNGNGGASAKSIALRADMDALPITEQTGKPHASQTPGLMHACGHDGHTAILVGAARVLSKIEHRPKPVTFVFQPAEEGGGGGEKLCDAGVLLGQAGGGIGTPVERIFGLHGWPNLGLGTVATRPGPMLSAVDDFVVTVKGKGGHAAMPHQCIDPIVASAAIVQALQTITSRSTSPLDSVVCTVGRFEGGTADNIIPDSVELEGTIRTLTAETRSATERRFKDIVTATARAHGCDADIDWRPGYPVTHNHDDATETFFEVARRAIGDDRVQLMPDPAMGGEDFSYYGLHVPACFFTLGLTPGHEGFGLASVPQLHQPTFDFNDDAIALGVELMVRLALEG
ncbi:MAG: amidohydrolase [Planctomycetota bacterium]